MTLRRGLALAALLGVCACNPDNQALGEGAVFVWPFVGVFALLVQQLVVTVWRPLLPTADASQKATGAFLALTLAGPLVVALAAPKDRWPLWALAMLWMFGASYTTVVLLATRLAIAVAPRYLALVGQLVASGLFLPPAIALATNRWPTAPHLLGFFWYVGYGGIGTTLAGGALIAEALLRRAR